MEGREETFLLLAPFQAGLTCLSYHFSQDGPLHTTLSWVLEAMPSPGSFRPSSPGCYHPVRPPFPEAPTPTPLYVYAPECSRFEWAFYCWDTG